MTGRAFGLLVIAATTALTFAPLSAGAQKPSAAVYITDEEVKIVNTQPGIDRQIRVVDIGSEHFAVGIVHRPAPALSGANVSAPRGAGAAGGGGAAGGAAVRPATPAPTPCGDRMETLPADATAGIYHDSQTEGYYIVSGGGTLVTGGKIVNGNKSAPDGAVTKELNGPSCSGAIVGAAGADVVKKVVKAGDIIIIPAGVPHGWSDIGDHVDYLSFRPSGHELTAGYVHPSIRKP